METTRMTIGELAEAAGLTRRAIRFYVQRGLLDPPEGRGRGATYGPEHLDRLRQLIELQSAGHSLDAIERIFQGEAVPEPHQRITPPRGRRTLAAELWTRIQLLDGVELSFDATKHNPEVEDLLAIKEMLRSMFESDSSEKN